MSKGKTVEESIRIQAYLLSEREGHPAGMEGFFWRQAQALVAAKSRGAAKLKAKKSKTKVKAKTPAPAVEIPLVVDASKPKAAPKTAKIAKPAKPAKSSLKKKDA
jgi:hypothetical protein